MQFLSDSECAYFERAADEVRRAPQDFYIIDTETRPDGLIIIRYAPVGAVGGGMWLEVPEGWV